MYHPHVVTIIDYSKGMHGIFVSSRLDAGNSILYGIAQGQLQRIERTQNTAAKIITNTRRYEHITPVLQQLHWLPIQEQIEFKVL